MQYMDVTILLMKLCSLISIHGVVAYKMHIPELRNGNIFASQYPLYLIQNFTAVKLIYLTKGYKGKGGKYVHYFLA